MKKQIFVVVVIFQLITSAANLCSAQLTWFVFAPTGSDPRSTISNNHQGAKFVIGATLPANFQLEVANDINLSTKGGQSIPAAVRAFRIDGTPFLHATGTNSLSVGPNAGIINTGSENVFAGFNSGILNTTGFSNSFFGASSGAVNTTGKSNVFIGINSGSQNSSGSLNTFVGSSAGAEHTSGGGNTFIGYNTGWGSPANAGNTFIGHFSTGTSGINNATAIGTSAHVSASNSLVLGNNVNVGINVSAPLYKLHVEGDIFAGNGDLLLRTPLNKISSSKYGFFGSAAGFDFNPSSTLPGILMESGENVESGGFYADGDYAVIWSPGDQDRLLRVIDEDGMIERWYLDGNGNAFKNSDKNKKENISPLENSLLKVKAMRGVNYNWKQNEHSQAKALDGKNRTVRDVKSLGFIAQELETVLPEAVATDEQGNKFVSYEALIPVLVEALKEQQAQIDSLKSAKQNSLKYGEAMLATNCVLYQNAPNPFRSTTTIKFHLTDDIQTAFIFVYDMQGKLIKQYPIKDKGDSGIEINGGELVPGMYLYSLIADGKEIDTRRMILSK
jgi:hypothetical protein